MNYKAVVDFLEGCKKAWVNIHSFTLYREDEKLLDFALPPYTTDDKQQLFSMSKSFTSVAFGMLYDDGLIKPDDTLLSVFPEYEKYITDERVKSVTFRYLLSMTGGHDHCLMNEMYQTDGAIRYFFAAPLVNDPGTTFMYSTAGTFMVAAAVERITGRSLVDFLDDRLFRPLGIEKPEWETLEGICRGGVGLFLPSTAVRKFASMLFNRGEYCGKRIVSAEYIDMASSKQTSNDGNGTPDWCAGYGFQMWRNARDGFRCDGAYGQLCAILPNRKMYFTLLGEVGNMQKEMDLCFDLADTISGEGGTKEEMQQAVDAFYAPVPSDENLTLCEEYKNERYGTVKLNITPERLDVSFGGETLTAGRHEYIYSEPLLYRVVPRIWLSRLDGMEKLCVRSIFDVRDGVVTAVPRSVNTPHTLTMTLTRSDDALAISFATASGSIDAQGSSIIAQKA